MIKTKYTATKKACFWGIDKEGWKLMDHKGDVYKDKYGLWLRTPTGFTKIDISNIVKDITNPITLTDLDIMQESEQMV